MTLQHPAVFAASRANASSGSASKWRDTMTPSSRRGRRYGHLVAQRVDGRRVADVHAAALGVAVQTHLHVDPQRLGAHALSSTADRARSSG